MTAYVDLEVGLHRRNVDYYEVQLRISQLDSDADISPPQNGPQLVKLDLERLRSLERMDLDYGRELSKSLFKDERVLKAFKGAHDVAQSHNQALRFRLVIGPSAPELHSLHWEKLRVPDQDSSLGYERADSVFPVSEQLRLASCMSPPPGRSPVPWW